MDGKLHLPKECLVGVKSLTKHVTNQMKMQGRGIDKKKTIIYEQNKKALVARSILYKGRPCCQGITCCKPRVKLEVQGLMPQQ